MTRRRSFAFTLAAMVLGFAVSAPEVSAEEIAMGQGQEVIGSEQGLQDWLAQFRPRALAAGIAPAVLEPALKQIRFLPDVVQKDRSQAEFTRAVWDYLDRAVSELRIAQGRTALAANAGLLARIEASYGVDPAYVVAIWGLETSYGTGRGDVPTLSALASLAYEGRRGAYFEQELLQVLRMLQSGDALASDLVGSWAGAMGHTQFMPSSFWAVAVDFDGDGRRNLWGDDPTDALASAAAYLKSARWVSGQDWGHEVRLPPDFDWELAGGRTLRPMSFWAAKGVLRADGGALEGQGWASILLPGGHRGPALMLFENFSAIETYNMADAYVIAVCHLADRLRGGGPFVHSWPRDLRVLTFDERVELQQRLTAAGHSTAGVDGRIGPRSLSAIKSFQRDTGLVVDGFASNQLLDRLRVLQAAGERR